MKSSISSGLPQQPPNVSDADFGKLLPVYKAIHALEEQLGLLTGNVSYSAAEMLSISPLAHVSVDRANVVYAQAAVALTFGQLVNFSVVGSTLTAKVASKSGTILPAHAIVLTSSGIAAGAWGSFRLMHGHCSGVSGTAVGSQYWLGDAGTMQIAKPTTAGQLAQQVAVGFGSLGVFLSIPNLGVTV